MDRDGYNKESANVKELERAYHNGKKNGKKIDRQHLIDDGKARKYYGDIEPTSEEETYNGPAKVSFFSLFRYADGWDRLMTIVGCLCALGHGASWPYMLVLLSDTIGKFVDFARYDNFLDKIEGLLSTIGFTKDDARKNVEKLQPFCPILDSVYKGDDAPNCSKIASIDNLFDDMEDLSFQYIVGGFIVMALAFGQCYCFFVASERQIIRMRSAFFRNILRQEMGYFDTSSTGEITVKLTDDIGKIHDSIGDKTGTSLQWVGSAFGGFTMCFAYGWELALVMQIASPLLFLSFAVVGMVYTNMSRMEREAYAKAGGVAEEVISSMRTVQAFGGQEKEAQRYARGLTEAKDLGVRKSMVNGIGTGIGWCIIFSNWGLGFWYGGWLVRHSDYSVKDMMTVFFTSLIGCLSLGLAMPSLITINTGRVAAFGVFQIIDRKSKIDGLSTAGACPPSLKGSVSLRGVHFSYPSRPDVRILNGLDLYVPAGKTVALVGSSGCGKSTVIQLLLRFYDPERGQVYFDDVDVRGLNIKYLRQHLGFVGQEPVLFSTTIADNIRYGHEGVTMEEIVDACRRANAYDFIMKMPDQFNTQVGERGAQLSGGQKQRIAIARALVKNPKVLLLDEATSALDNESESIVQDALEKASKGRTTIVVAHRLSTVRNADLIVAFDQGVVAETGTHDELMAKGGTYYNLVSSQHSSYAKKLGMLSLQRGMRIVNFSKLLNCAAGHFRTNFYIFTNVTRQKNSVLEILQKMIISNNEFLLLKSSCSTFRFSNGFSLMFDHENCPNPQAYSKDDLGRQSEIMATMAVYSVGVGVLSLLTYFAQEYMFGRAGEVLTLRMRDMLFRAILRQNIGWFDDSRHETGILTSQLATEATVVQGAMKTTFGCTMLMIGNLGTGLIISFIMGWQLALVLIGFIPFIVGAGILTSRFLGGAYNGGRAAMEEGSKVAALAALDNQRTVAALTLEQKLSDIFRNTLSGPFRSNIRQAFYACLTFSVTQGMYYIAFGVCFYYGSKLMEKDKIEFDDVFKVYGCIIMGSVQLGRAVALTPDAGKAVRAAKKIFSLHDHVPPIDAYSSAGKKPKEGTFRSTIHLKNVHFRYPNRPDVKVLNDVTLSIAPGQTLALVGESGCGKSTTTQLLERFYDPEKGEVIFDEFNIKDLNLQWLRSQIGLVSQEPILFDTSIAENIAYGDNSREVLMEEIIQAAKAANVHSFITALPGGYTTRVGSKGTLLSGGQKQRVAIARALVRNPKILLLDEATSALDTENEK
ncbi:hypothetical protein EGW08_002005, partial [Elysia chlorotica]